MSVAQVKIDPDNFFSASRLIKKTEASATANVLFLSYGTIYRAKSQKYRIRTIPNTLINGPKGATHTCHG
jgi:hypothetical protein